MHIAVIRERKGADGTISSKTVWEFSIRLGAVKAERTVMELVALTKLKPHKGENNWRVVERWGEGWSSGLTWADIRVPIDVVREVEEVLRQKISFAQVRAGNTILVVERVNADDI